MGKVRKGIGFFRAVGIMVLGAYVPNFFKIHLRYIRNNLRAWLVLFIAPFLAIKMFMIAVFDRISQGGDSAWGFDIIAILSVAVCFVLAERHAGFRRVYVFAVPAIMAIGLLYWAGSNGGYINAGYFVKACLIGFLTYRVGRFTITRGYQQLSDGADKDFRQGKSYYEDGAYDLAIPFLETAAKRGHFKSLFLLGDAYEHGHHVEKDLPKAAEYFIKSSRKGYGKAGARYDQLLESLPPAQRAEIRDVWGR